jgi:peptide/nickel transport system permease protein
MLGYASRRILTGVILIILVSAITFWLLSFSFESIVANRLGQAANPESIAALKSDLGLDRPVPVMYLDWLGHVLTGNLGASFYTGEPVSSAVGARMAVTLSVILPALIISVVIAVGLGVVAAARGGWIDKVLQGIMLSGHLVPGLLVAIFLVSLLSVSLGWLPAGGYTPPQKDAAAWARSITIPVIVLCLGGAANIATQVRGTMIDELRKDYVRTLRTRGVGTTSLVVRHALRNAAGPALTVVGLEFTSMFFGALVIEQVFALPGVGVYSFNASLEGDFPIIMGLVIFTVGLTVSINLLTDLANGWLNPKARLH